VPTATHVDTSGLRFAALIFLLLAALFSAGCATTGGADEEADPTVIEPVAEVSDDAETAPETPPAAAEESKEQEGELPLTVADAEPIDAPIPEVVVQRCAGGPSPSRSGAKSNKSGPSRNSNCRAHRSSGNRAEGHSPSARSHRASKHAT
jgi:hypothetical protein